MYEMSSFSFSERDAVINGDVTKCLSTTMFDRSDVIDDDCIFIDLEQRENESVLTVGVGGQSWMIQRGWLQGKMGWRRGGEMYVCVTDHVLFF